MQETTPRRPLSAGAWSPPRKPRSRAPTRQHRPHSIAATCSTLFCSGRGLSAGDPGRPATRAAPHRTLGAVVRAVAPRADSGRLREEPGLQLPEAPGARAKTGKRRGDALQRPAARGEVGWG
ncbi:hypothetical protein J1605_022570 [Eschrichtius robustus]|uniref:Uncharacterized protein n=1 Tax=Eschrichtius robustus TaxID=9764 RepID=A0AB34H651_ESCRO|nr:hypothetical protein J1605_022570 [Eschrichtius robustus]